MGGMNTSPSGARPGEVPLASPGEGHVPLFHGADPEAWVHAMFQRFGPILGYSMNVDRSVAAIMFLNQASAWAALHALASIPG